MVQQAIFFLLSSTTITRPVARIFRRGVTWVSNLHRPKHTRVGGFGGHAPPGNF